MEGNQMKMHEALLKAIVLCNDAIEGGEYMGEGPDPNFGKIKELLSGALSAPARNCDRFKTAEEAWNAYDEWEESFKMNRRMPPYNVFGWLFATATKSKGDTDGQ